MTNALCGMQGRAQVVRRHVGFNTEVNIEVNTEVNAEVNTVPAKSQIPSMERLS